jgi:hypothetical protein
MDYRGVALPSRYGVGSLCKTTATSAPKKENTPLLSKTACGIWLMLNMGNALVLLSSGVA